MIKSKRLSYRLFKKTDFNDLKAMYGSDAFCQYLPVKGHLNDVQIQRYLDKLSTMKNDDQSSTIFAVVYENDVIGYAGIVWVKEVEHYEIMYGFNESYWQMGFGKEAAAAMKLLAKQRNLRNVVAFAHIDNVPSQRILTSIGYHKVKQVELWGLDLYYYEMDLK